MQRRTRIRRLKRRFPSRNKNKRAGEKTIVSRDLCHHIASEVLKRKPQTAAKWIRAAILPALPKRSNWHRELRKLAVSLDAMALGKKLTCRVFGHDGNGKLPFVFFSALPQYTCPGAGECLDWCYSFTGWRHVSPFTRQVLNTMLLKHAPEYIAEEWKSLPNDIEVRLYVDGDFDSAETMEFWFDLCRARPDLHIYGYSKSWALFIEHDRNGNGFPSNYVLNLSSGSKYEGIQGYADAMEGIKREDGGYLVRGYFVAVHINGKGIPRGIKRYTVAEYHKRGREAAREEYGQTPLSCPGDCGNCPGARQQCGLDRNEPKMVLIAIGVHGGKRTKAT